MLELGAGELGQVDRLANGLGGGLRAVGANHDASEHAASSARSLNARRY